MVRNSICGFRMAAVPLTLLRKCLPLHEDGRRTGRGRLSYLSFSAKRGICWLALFGCTLVLQAQNSDGSAASVSPTPPPTAIAPAAPLLAVQKVGGDDLLSLSVSDSPELTRNFRVSGDGSLTLPWLTTRIVAAGKTPPEIADAVAAELEKEQILVHPVVSVTVLEYHSVPVSVLGAVKHPITFQAAGGVTLLDAITRADGLTTSAGPYILVTHPHRDRDQTDGSTGELVQRIPVKGLLDDADTTLNFRLSGGEEIRVPEAGHIYVLGNVRKPGAYQITDNGDITILKLVAQSEGLLPFTNKTAYVFRRVNGQALRSEIAVPLNDIVHRKAADVALEANDIIYVPDSKGKRVTAQTIERVTNFGVGTASGYLIFH